MKRRWKIEICKNHNIPYNDGVCGFCFPSSCETVEVEEIRVIPKPKPRPEPPAPEPVPYPGERDYYAEDYY